MHEMPDTDDTDAAAERFWPENYKRTLRDRVSERVVSAMTEAGAFELSWETSYAAAFESHAAFAWRIAEIVAIGAENGTDASFDGIHAALRNGTPPPDARVRTRDLWPQPIDDELGARLHTAIAAEYRDSHAFEHLHEDHYSGDLRFDDFVDRIAGLVVIGGVNGADDALATVYRALLTGSPLPTARRRPRRIR
jgi:hypothetical protein